MKSTFGGVSAARPTWNAAEPAESRMDLAKVRRLQLMSGASIAEATATVTAVAGPCFRVAAVLLAAAMAAASDDPVAALDRRLATGAAELRFAPKWGYLTSVLEELEVPLSSQVLVFSKTSAQFQWITPRNPRAIYFNDQTYVGWVPNAPVLEISTATAGGEVAFYTLRQRPVAKPRFVADNGSCLQCHESFRTLGVPGHLTRSVFPAADGLPHFGHGTLNVDHSTPIANRWGGWFVTGRVGARHRGNAVGPEDRFDAFVAGSLARAPAGFFNPERYPTPFSDVVAHLVLAHQTRVHNSIARAGHEARAALAYQEQMERIFGESSESLVASVRRRIEGPSEQLVRDLLLVGEARLDGPVSGLSGFAEEFQARGVRDSRGRSLRELDLGSRLFRYPCSFLIRSAEYASLPERVRDYVESRLVEILAGTDNSGAFEHLGVADRSAIRELLATR